VNIFVIFRSGSVEAQLPNGQKEPAPDIKEYEDGGVGHFLKTQQLHASTMIRESCHRTRDNGFGLPSGLFTYRAF